MEFLPAIWIKIPTDKRIFFHWAEKFAELSNDISEYQAEYDFFEKGRHVLNLRPRQDNQHEGLYGQFITSPTDVIGNISIEIRALKWSPDPVSREIYVAEAKRIFKPIVQAYNSVHACRLRMNVQCLKAKSPAKLPPKALQKLKRFSVYGNVSHPIEWKNFYVFIRHCYAHRVNLTESQLCELLKLENFSAPEAHKLSNIFAHGLDLLRTR